MSKPYTSVFASAEEKALARAPIGKLFPRFVFPSVIGFVFSGAQSLIDGVIVGNYISPHALGAVNLVLPCYTFVNAFAIMMGIGCQTVVSHALGQRNDQRANTALRTATMGIFAVCLVITLLLAFNKEALIRALGADDILFPYAIDYLRGFIPFMPIIALYFLSDYNIKAIGRPVYAMSVLVSTVALNLILDFVFVAFLDMGTYGAGLATGIAFCTGSLLTFPMLIGKLSRLSIFKGRFDIRLFFRMLYNGSSEGLSELSAGISIMMFNITLMHLLGADGVTAFTAINYITFMGCLFFLGVSDGVIPIIAYNYGAQRMRRIKQTLRTAAITNTIIGICIFVIITIFAPQIVGIFFGKGQQALIDTAASGARLYCIGFFLTGMNILASSFFTALGNAKISAMFALMRGLIFIVIGLQIWPLLWGLQGVWLTLPLSELITFGFVVFFTIRQIKKLKGR